MHALFFKHLQDQIFTGFATTGPHACPGHGLNLIQISYTHPDQFADFTGSYSFAPANDCIIRNLV